MIIDIHRFTKPRAWEIPGVFNVVNTQTNEYVSEPVFDNYYIFDPPFSRDTIGVYKRVVSLDVISRVVTEFEDDLTPYGFVLIDGKHDYRGKLWIRTGREERFNTDNSSKEFTYPAISFKPLENKDKKSVIEYMNSHPEISNFIVYLRCKYEHQTEWEYLIEACSPDCNDEILWLTDWHEGQQDVEYLAITQIDFWRELSDN